MARLGEGISLGRLGPIPIRLDPSLFLILGLIGYRKDVTLNEILVWVVVAAFCILVHELGHAVAFLSFGRKPSVLLYGFGGVTSAEGGLGPWASLTTSLAGPVAGFGLGGLILLAAMTGGAPQSGTLVHTAFLDGLWACFGFGVFNLLPILPLDGGAAVAAFLRGVRGPSGEQVARYISIAFAALLWAYLDAQANGLQINAGVSDRLVLVIQGVIVLSVVIAYEIVRRAGVAMEQRRVASQLAAASATPEKQGAAT